jgi:hypothetical protein
MSDLTIRAVSEVLSAQIIIGCMKAIMPMDRLNELAIKLEAIGRCDDPNSPFRELERDAVLREARGVAPAIQPFRTVDDVP